MSDSMDDEARRGPGRPRKLLNLDAGTMDREIAQEARKASALHQPMLAEGMHRKLTDDEILARGDLYEVGQFDVPQEIIPEGFVYQWHRTEVYGQPDNKSITNALRNGWRAVPASRHDGVWTPPGHDGHIDVEGQRLMELPEPEAYNRARHLYLKAKMQRQAGAEMLGRAPPGTGPRSHPGVRPTLSVTREQLSVE